MRDLQLAVRGTRQRLMEKPFAVFSCCPTSPLKWSTVPADNAMKCAELGVPVEFISMPLAGLVAPISLVGCVIQHTAETLSGVVLSQTTRPGAPILYGGSPGIFDMRSMAATISAVEAQMLNCACVEVGKYLGLPTQAYIGMSDSKSLDAQAGFESGTGAYLAALAGINSISGPGMLYFESCQSLEKLVFDAETCGIARRLIAGVEPGEDFPCDDLFGQLLREGQLLTSTFMDYLLPTINEVPMTEKAALVTPSPFAPLGAKGCGEGAIHAAPAAVMCAVNDALAPLGVLATEVPATPNRLWKLIQGAKSPAPGE